MEVDPDKVFFSNDPKFKKHADEIIEREIYMRISSHVCARDCGGVSEMSGSPQPGCPICRIYYQGRDEERADAKATCEACLEVTNELLNMVMFPHMDDVTWLNTAQAKLEGMKHGINYYLDRCKEDEG